MYNANAQLWWPRAKHSIQFIKTRLLILYMRPLHLITRSGPMIRPRTDKALILSPSWLTLHQLSRHHSDNFCRSQGDCDTFWSHLGKRRTFSWLEGSSWVSAATTGELIPMDSLASVHRPSFPVSSNPESLWSFQNLLPANLAVLHQTRWAVPTETKEANSTMESILNPLVSTGSEIHWIYLATVTGVNTLEEGTNCPEWSVQSGHSEWVSCSFRLTRIGT